MLRASCCARACLGVWCPVFISFSYSYAVAAAREMEHATYISLYSFLHDIVITNWCIAIYREGRGGSYIAQPSATVAQKYCGSVGNANGRG